MSRIPFPTHWGFGLTGSMARSMSLLWAAGGTIVLLSLLIGHQPGVQKELLRSVVVLTYVVSIGVRVTETWLPYWAYQVLAAAGTAVITLVIYAGGGIGTSYHVVYLWVVIFAFFYFGRAGALLQLGLVVMASVYAYVGPMHAAVRLPMPAANLVELLGTVAGAAVVTNWMIAQFRLQSQMSSELALSRQRAQAMEQENRAKTRLLTTISHEMTTPLSAVLGFQKLLAESPLNPTQQRQNNNVALAGNQMLYLVADLRDLAMTVTGELQVAMEQIDLSPLVGECVASVGPQLDAGQVGLNVSCPERLAAFADRRRLGQVILNLLSNAIKFTPSGGQISVTVGQPDDSRVEITVEDTGVGIPAEQLDEIFGEFVQLDAGRRAGGLGLGLAISRALVRAMGGEIVAASSPGEGSVFRILLPTPSSNAVDGMPN